MGLRHFGTTDDVDVLVSTLRADGAIVVDDAIDGDVVDTVLAEMREHHDAAGLGTDRFSGRNTRRSGSLIARSPASWQLVTHPIVLALCDRVLGANAATYQVHLTQLIDIGPGEPAQMLHRDQWAWDQFPFPPGFEVELSTIWAANDFTDDNGATRIVLGSTAHPDGHPVTHADTIPAEMTTGSVVVYTGSVFHGGGANRTEQRRIGINIDYCLGWLRQEENQYLSCPPDIAKHLPIELARLIGYQRAAYALGYFGDTQDPIEALHPRRTSTNTFAL